VSQRFQPHIMSPTTLNMRPQDSRTVELFYPLDCMDQGVRLFQSIGGICEVQGGLMVHPSTVKGALYLSSTNQWLRQGRQGVYSGGVAVKNPPKKATPPTPQGLGRFIGLGVSDPQRYKNKKEVKRRRNHGATQNTRSHLQGFGGGMVWLFAFFLNQSDTHNRLKLEKQRSMSCVQ